MNLKQAIILSIASLSILLSFLSCNTKTHIKDVTTEQFEQVIKNSNIQIVDIRTPKEFAQGHLHDAILIDVKSDKFKDLALSKLHKDLPVAVYCRSGKRSALAAKILSDLGFKKVYNMEGGFTKWAEEDRARSITNVAE